MKSVKPGRGPSFMSGISSILIALFGVVWTIVAASMGGGLFALFGIIFIAYAVIQAVYNFKNATGKNRYSQFDITDENEEIDPFNERFGSTDRTSGYMFNSDTESKFCPYCGTKVEADFEFCNKCGKKLP